MQLFVLNLLKKIKPYEKNVPYFLGFARKYYFANGYKNKMRKRNNQMKTTAFNTQNF